VQAHAADLRAEIPEEEPGREQLVEAIARDWRQAELSPADQALCRYAEKLTRTPAEVGEADLEGLRAEGFDDVALHDLFQVVAYFNYINRIADAVHVELEPEMEPYPDEGAS